MTFGHTFISLWVIIPLVVLTLVSLAALVYGGCKFIDWCMRVEEMDNPESKEGK